MSALSDVLRRYEAAMRARGIVWGQTDCVHFVAECADAVRPSDCGSRVSAIPPYCSMVGACLALRRRGWRDLADMLDSYGARVRACDALVGDVALAEPADGDDAAGPIGALGVVIGADAVFLAPGGFARRPLSSLLLWRLG